MTQQLNDPEREIVTLELSRWKFYLVWWGLLLAHAGCAAFLFANNLLYSYLGDISLIYYNKLLASSLQAQLAKLGWLFSIFGAVHCLEMLKMLLFSLHARELSFRFQPRTKKITPALPGSVIAVRGTNQAGPNEDTVVGATNTAEPKAPSSPQMPRMKRVIAPLVRITRKANEMRPKIPHRASVFGRRVFRVLLRIRKRLYDRHHGYMSVQSNYFNYLFLIREMIEIASQSYQMYNSSMLLARPWINAFFMSLVVVNCWSTPILQHVLAHSSGLERVVCLTLDGLLDAGSAILIPLIVFLPYARVFDRDSLSFPSDNLYDPQWFVNMVRENRMLFAMSSQDLFSKLVPHHSLWSCMKNIKKLIVRQKYPSESSYAPGATDSPAKDGDHDLVTKKVDSSPKQQVEYPGKGKKLVHVVFTSWGIAVLVIYLHARHVSVSTDVPACKLPLRPWFATTFACASYNFDCHEQGQVDTVTSSDLSILRNDSLAALIISNCPAVKMPPELRNFPNLLKFLLYNSTIASWDSTSSLNSVDHTSLVSICLVRVNMTEFPLGLQQELPSPLTDIQVSMSNLTYLPSSLSQKWQPMTIMYFEFCDFTEFPLVLLDLRADEVSLAGAKITALPSNMSSAQFAWIGLVLSGNALLSELPDAGLKSGLLTLSIENTNVSEIPSWVYSGMQSFAGGFVVYAYNTPFCLAENTTSSATSSGGSGATGASSAEETVSTSSGGSGAAPTGSAGGGMTSGTVNCVTRDPSGEARYPLALTTSAFQPS